MFHLQHPTTFFAHCPLELCPMRLLSSQPLLSPLDCPRLSTPCKTHRMTSLRICPHPSQEIVRLPPKTPKHVVDGSSLVLVHTGPYWSNHPLDVRSDLGQYHRSISFFGMFLDKTYYIYICTTVYIAIQCVVPKRPKMPSSCETIVLFLFCAEVLGRSSSSCGRSSSIW